MGKGERSSSLAYRRAGTFSNMLQKFLGRIRRRGLGVSRCDEYSPVIIRAPDKDFSPWLNMRRGKIVPIGKHFYLFRR